MKVHLSVILRFMIAKSQSLQDEKGIESEDEAGGRCRAAIIPDVSEMLHKWVGYTGVYTNMCI